MYEGFQMKASSEQLAYYSAHDLTCDVRMPNSAFIEFERHMYSILALCRTYLGVVSFEVAHWP